MLGFQEAKDIILSQAYSFGTENVLIDKSLGRILAEDIFSDRDYPSFNRASMDGYALRFDDFENGIKEFTCVKTILAGQTCIYEIKSGECYKIMTGASVPVSADIVIRVEDSRFVGSSVNRLVAFDFSSPLKKFQNISRRGEDTPANSLVIQKGTRITPQVIGALASFGRGKILVEKLPRVTIISTGDEIVGVNDTVSPVQIRNSNQHVLQAMLQTHQMQKVKLLRVKDNKKSLRTALEKAVNNSDLLLISGGVSAGDADFVPQILSELGVEKIFHKTKIRPGKPMWFGKKPNGCTVFALPGNPLSCQTTFKLFVEPFLAKCFGTTPTGIYQFPMAESRSKKTDLDEFFPITLQGSPTQVSIKKFNGSGDITAGLFAEGMAWQPADKMILDKGDVVTVFLF